MSKNKKRLKLAEEAKNWAFEQSCSTAKTQPGKDRAVKKYAEEKQITDLKQTYLTHLQNGAGGVMFDDLAHREYVVGERKQIKKIPVWTRHHLAYTKEVQKTYKSNAGTKEMPGWIEQIIMNIAYNDIFSGMRKRKIYVGKNVYRSPGHRETNNGKGGWDKVVWHYADYTAISNRKGLIAYRTNHSKQFEILHCFNDHLKIRGEIYKKPIAVKEEKTLSPHHLRRFFNISKNPIVKWIWDMDEKAGYYRHGNEKYHTVTKPEKSSREYLREAVQAFKKRKREKLAEARVGRIFQNLHKIYVTVEDSVESGNCETQTNDMRDKIARELHAEGDFAVRADFLWEHRSDSYTRRAILKASEHVRI